MTREHQENRRVDRRAFLRDGVVVLAAASCDPSRLLAEKPTDALRVGLITDLHYADKPNAGTRHYRETLSKLSEAGKQFQKAKTAFAVEMGDFIDAASSVSVEKGYLKTINREFTAVSKERHHVLGNHCVDTLKKEEFLEGVQQKKSYYSFDRSGIHFVILDSCFRSDGTPYQRKNFDWTDPNIPAKELDWLKSDLASNDKPVVVFAHQRLDVSNSYGVKNNVAVRQVLEASGDVVAVFQGHSHENDLKQIGGIHYCTLVAMVEGSGPENNGYSVMEIEPNGTIRLSGFRKQKSRNWDRSK